MEPVSYSIQYADADGRARQLRVEGAGRFAVQDAAFELTWDGEVLELVVEPAAPLELRACEVLLAHGFGPGARVLANGYQSWTETRWLGRRDRMPGLAHVPRAVVGRWQLDGGGDYRFTAYDDAPGRFHGFTYLAVREGGAEGATCLVGSLDERRGLTCVRADLAAGEVRLVPECPQAPLAPGARMAVGRWAVVRGAEEEAYDRWFALADVRARPAPPLCGYSSWYRRYDDIDAHVLQADLAGAAAALGPGGRVAVPDGFARVFQIDDGWCCVGDWDRPDAGRFPDGLAPLAAAAREAGLLPGLWMAPLCCSRRSRVFACHPDWLLRDEEGRAVSTGSHWGGAYALDVRNPDVRSYVADVVRRAVREWGFGLLKLDFLYAACLEPRDGLNRGQLMADAWDLLRGAAGEDCLLLACGVPLGPVMGRADYCRVGCDVGLDWDDAPHMRVLHRERVSTKNSLGNTVTRGPLDGRAFANDPDVCFLRDDVRLTAAQREKLICGQERHAGMLLTSDDMGAWDDAACARYGLALERIADRRHAGGAR